MTQGPSIPMFQAILLLQPVDCSNCIQLNPHFTFQAVVPTVL